MTKLIPFDRKKYEQGAKVIRRDGLEVLAIFFDGDHKEHIFQIYRKKPGLLNACHNFLDGTYDLKCNDNDLFLERKTIDLWIGLDYEFTIFPNDEKGLQCTTYAYQAEAVIPLNCVKVKITLDASTMEQIL